jgi:hypothetical protein
MKDVDSSVALEAAAFWQAIAERGASMEEQRAAREAIAPYLSQLVPALLTGMVYDEDDASMEFADDDDAHIPDKEEDIAPSVSKRGEVEDDEDEDEDNDGGEDTWNLRKGSAAALDLMSYVFQNDMLQVLLPLIEQLLQSPDWQRRESAILAIGAVADNCGQLVEPHLGTLMPFLLTTIDDPKPLIRSISCWAVSKYALPQYYRRAQRDQFCHPSATRSFNACPQAVAKHAGDITRIRQVQALDCQPASGERRARYCLRQVPQTLFRQQQTCAGGCHLGKILAFRALSQGGYATHIRIETMISILD